jgi:hypothetical protein
MTNNKILKDYGKYTIEESFDRYLVRRKNDNFVLRVYEKSQLKKETVITYENDFFKRL